MAQEICIEYVVYFYCKPNLDVSMRPVLEKLTETDLEARSIGRKLSNSTSE